MLAVREGVLMRVAMSPLLASVCNKYDLRTPSGSKDSTCTLKGKCRSIEAALHYISERGTGILVDQSAVELVVYF